MKIILVLIQLQSFDSGNFILPPPQEIQTIAEKHNQGFFCDENEMEKLSDFIEFHPRRWNAWAEKKQNNP